nr:cytochrome c biogenesis protein ResB [Bacillus subtilis]
MKQVKCECGHINPVGTVLCESCGRALQETQPPLADMRYDGSARRSQTYNKTIIDKIWNFFSSVKVGIWLIVITLAASAFGTIFPQEAYLPPGAQADTYYKEQYGTFGTSFIICSGFIIYMVLGGISLLIASIGISLVICGLDRVIPLYRALKNQGVRRSPAFLRRRRLFSETVTVLNGESKEKIVALLKKKHYRIREKEGEILAEKGRFSRCTRMSTILD